MRKTRIVSIIMLAVLLIGIACVAYGVTGTNIYVNAVNMMGSDKKTAMSLIQSPDKLTEIGSVTEPEPELTALYEDRYRRFRRIYPALRPLFPELL